MNVDKISQLREGLKAISERIPLRHLATYDWGTEDRRIAKVRFYQSYDGRTFPILKGTHELFFADIDNSLNVEMNNGSLGPAHIKDEKKIEIRALYEQNGRHIDIMFLPARHIDAVTYDKPIEEISNHPLLIPPFRQ